MIDYLTLIARAERAALEAEAQARMMTQEGSNAAMHSDWAEVLLDCRVALMECEKRECRAKSYVDQLVDLFRNMSRDNRKAWPHELKRWANELAAVVLD